MNTIQTIRAIWQTVPLSEKLGAIGFAFGFPLIMLGLALIAP